MGIPLQAVVSLKAGHSTLVSGLNANYSADWEQLLYEAVMQITLPGQLPSDEYPELIDTGSWHFWRVNTSSQQMEAINPSGGYPFTLEAPYKVAPGQRWPMVLVGEPGSGFEVTITDGGTTVWSNSGTLPASGIQVIWSDSPPGPAGREYSYNLRIQKPGGSWQTVANTNTPTGDAARMYVMESEPITGGSSAQAQFSPPRLPNRATNWGLSEY
jgi:hypothetical protein